MSFILDALRKSETRAPAPERAEHGGVPGRARRPPPAGALIAIGFLLAINVAVVLFFMLRQSPAPAAAASQIAAADKAASVTSPPPVSAAPPAATLPAPQSELQSAQNAAGQFAESPLELYGESATQPPDAPDPTLLPDAHVSSPGVTYGDAPPDEAPTAEAASGLPALTVDLHIYANDPAKRAVFINGRRYTQGAHTGRGPDRRGDHARRRRALVPRPALPAAAARSRGATLNAAVHCLHALDGTQLSAALRSGIHRLISREEVINKINVFPVPDGDTGTNLALTAAGGAHGAARESRGARGPDC